MAKQPIRQREKPTQSVTSTSIENWSGPLPPPAALESFNRIIPGGAERILAMAEKEQGHRVELEKSQLAGAIKEARRGQWLGAAISFAAICGAIWIASLSGDWTVPVALLSVPVGAIIIAIVNRRSK